MNAPFVIFALPRSRTYWLSRYLTYRGWTCGHDQVRYVRSPDDVRSWLSLDRTGTVETAAAPFWKMVSEMRPDTRKIVIRRPMPEVIDSLKQTGIAFDDAKLVTTLCRAERKLDQIERAGALVVSFAALNTEAGRKIVFEHCLGLPFDPEWDKAYAAENLQIDLTGLLRYERANAPQLRRAEAACTRWIRLARRGGKVRHGKPRDDGVTIQEETVASVYRDGQHLFAEHCLAVGEPEDEWSRKNIPMLYQLEQAGALHFLTARLNGRMLAYLKTVIGPSLESTSCLSGTQTLFFASDDARGMGLGMALQHESIQAMTRRGLGEIIMRSGVRGSGPRLGILYRRLGAEEFGHLHRLDLKKAA